MATSVSIEVNVDPDGKVNAALGGMDARWQASTAKWGAAVDNFKNNLVAYNAVLKEGGDRLAQWDAAMAQAKSQGASFAQQLENASQELVNFNSNLDKMGQKAEYNMTVARAAAGGLERELGVGQGVGRALTTFIARSETLGPIFESAFNVVAAVAFGEVIIQLTTKLLDLYNATFVWTDAMKAAAAGQVSANFTIQSAVQKTKELEAEHFTNTHSGVQNATRDIEILAGKYQILNQQLDNLNRRRKADLGVADQTEKVTTSSGNRGVQFEIVPTAAAHQAQDDLQAIDRDLAVVNAQLKLSQEQGKVFGDKLSGELDKVAKSAQQAWQKQDELNQRIERAIAERDDRIFRAHEAEAKKQEKLDEQSLASALKIIEEIEKADEKRAQDHQHAADELERVDAQTLKMQENAAIGALPLWQRGAAQAAAYWEEAKARITAQFDQIRDHFKGDSDQLAQLGKDEAAQMVAAHQEANDRIVDAHRQMVDKLAGELDTLFTDMFDGHFTQHILDMAKKFGEKLLASLLLGIGSGQSQGSGGGIFGGNILGGLLGKLFGLGGGSGGGGFGFPIPGVSGNNSGGFNFGDGSIGSGGGFDFGSGGSPIGTASTFGLAPLAASGGISSGTGTSGILSSLNASPLTALVSKLAPNLFTNGAFGASGAALGATGLAAGLGGVIGGFSAGYSSGSIGQGLLSGGLMGGLGGILTGFAIGGPVGAAVGAAIFAGSLIAGLLGGIFGGNKKKHQAQDMDNQKFLPALSQLEQAYENYQITYADEQKQMSDLESQAQQALGQFGHQGSGVYNNEFLPQAQAVQRQIDAWEKDRQKRASIHFAPPEFHDGGEVPAILLSGETVMNRGATSRHRNTLRAMNEGSYSSGGGEVHIHLHTIDGASTEDWLTKRGGIQKIQRALMTDFLDYNGGGIG